MKPFLPRIGARMFLIPVALLLLGVGSLRAQSIEEAKLIDPNGVIGDQAGMRVEVWGDHAFVSAPNAYDPATATRCGAVHVYKKPEEAPNGWAYDHTLYPGNPTEGAMFGWSMDICDGVLIVGSRHGDGYQADTGAAYIFGFDGTKWTETDHLFEPNGAAGSGFGVDVAVDGDWAVIGIQYKNDGTAVLFRKDGSTGLWAYDRALDESGGQFGVAVDIWNDTIAVGANYDGDVFVYTYDETTDSWDDEQPIYEEGSDRFGSSLCLKEGILVVGSPQADASSLTDSGEAFIYEYDVDTEEWVETQVITGSTPAASDQFSASVAVSVNALNGHEVILVGAPYNDTVADDAGAVYVFERVDNGDWTETRILTARDGAAYDEFGLSVAMEDSVAVVGAWQGEGAVPNSGLAYLYRDACWASYGQGWPGSSGNIPELELSDDPILGQTVDLILGNSSGQAAYSLLFLGGDKSSIGTPFDGTLLVDYLLIIDLIVPGAGLTLSVEIPDDPAYSGVHLYLQLLQLESSPQKVVSFSRGLDILIGAY